MNYQKRHIAIMKQAKRFQEIFKVPITDFYSSSVLGFDLIKFDDEVIKSGELDGVSMSENVATKFGEEGRKMIESFLADY